MKAYKTKISILLLTIVTVLLTSCYISITPAPSPITDSRLDGTFYHVQTMPGYSQNDGYYKSSYIFDGTNRAVNRIGYWFYDYNDWKWEISGKYKGDYYQYDYEIEVNEAKTHFREKLWNNSSASWGRWQKYEFLNNGKTLRIWPVSPDKYFDYTRQ